MKRESHAQSEKAEASATQVLSCVECGACCTATEPVRAYVPLEMRDVRRLPERYRLHVVTSESGFDYLATGADRRRCVALTGDVGKRVHCEIYESRPEVCRRYKAGGYQCRLARKAEGVT